MKKKIEKMTFISKKEEGKNYLLSQLIKKIFALCVNLEKDQSNKNRESTHYYSGSTVSPHQVKINHTPASNSYIPRDLCEGYEILGMKP